MSSQKMPENELRKEIREYLDKRKVLVLCTCSNNIPRATPMDFYTDQDNFNIYVGPAPGRKVKNIEENPNISIGIYTPMSEGKIQGMQITATGRDKLIFLKEGDEEFKKAQKIVRGRRKLILKIIPEKLELLDYDFIKDGYSRLQILEL
ncbi:MAG: pyridoxamine 5'-phosphate oxidase family protein [Promethearchaeota archaeon]|jgi:nitroimidazol reductase NimA-like FMN-containing flavoprotein (pyridoxamine 5'-phosphate oxidase superfamily)